MAYLETISSFEERGSWQNLSKLDHIFKQSYNISEHYLVWRMGGGGGGRGEGQSIEEEKLSKSKIFANIGFPTSMNF